MSGSSSGRAANGPNLGSVIAQCITAATGTPAAAATTTAIAAAVGSSTAAAAAAGTAIHGPKQLP